MILLISNDFNNISNKIFNLSLLYLNKIVKDPERNFLSGIIYIKRNSCAVFALIYYVAIFILTRYSSGVLAFLISFSEFISLILLFLYLYSVIVT
jgi:hypothetical protein